MKIKFTNEKMSSERLISILLFLMVLIVYINVSQFEFTNFDDDIVVSQNNDVKRGLTLDNIGWAFSSLVAANWLPLTTLTHITDYALFGMNAGGHHMVNVLFHGLNSILMFLVFFRMTGAMRRSAIIAALFAFHPLHVGAVAWIAERKEVLCIFFWLLTMLAYVDYTKNPGKKNYMKVVIFFVMGIMSKPMIVTLPCVLILMDVWPLNRLTFFGPDGFDKKKVLLIIFEKVPLLTISAAMAVLTFSTQQISGAVQSMTRMSLEVRIANAVAAYGEYIFKTFVPINLSVHYPHHGMPPLWKWLPSLALLGFVTIFAVRNFKKYPYVLVGWLWFLGTLVPVIGLVQVGSQALADRYTYITITGLFIIIVWGVFDVFEKNRTGRLIPTAFFSVIIIIFASLSFCETLYWKNTKTIFTRALQVTENNFLAQMNLGVAFAEEGDLEKAISHYQKTIEIEPEYAPCYFNLGVEYQRMGAHDRAIEYYLTAIDKAPEMTRAYNNLAMIYTMKGKHKLAMEYLHKGETTNPNNVDINNNLAHAYVQEKNVQKAGQYYLRVIELAPSNRVAYCNVAALLYVNGKKDLAKKMYGKALDIDPEYIKAARALQKIKRDESNKVSD